MNNNNPILHSSSEPAYKIRKLSPVQIINHEESAHQVPEKLIELKEVERQWTQMLSNVISDPSYDAIRYPVRSTFFREDIDPISPEMFKFRAKKYLEVISGESQTEENTNNHARLEKFKTRFSNELIALISEDDFEYGFVSKVDLYIQKRMQQNALATKSWLNSIFIEKFEKIPIVLGLLRIVARIEYLDIYPEGQTMAIAALSHKNIEVRECGIRAFESWDTIESLHVLENLQGNASWLQSYIDDVVSALRRKYNARVGKKN